MRVLTSSQTAAPADDGAIAPGWMMLGAVSVVFHLGLIFYGLTPALVSRPLHMALLLPWVLVYMANTPAQRMSGWLLTVLGIAACLLYTSPSPRD